MWCERERGQCCKGQAEWYNDVQSMKRGRKDKQVFTHFKGVSCNLSSAINQHQGCTWVVVNTASPSQDKRHSFSLSLPFYWTPDVPSIEWPSPVGSNLRSVYHHSAEAFSRSEPAGKAADKPAPPFEWLIILKLIPEITLERAGGRK